MEETKKVSELDPVDNLDKTGILLVVQGGDTYRTTIDELLKLGSVPALKTGVMGGNFSSGYPDAPSANNSYGTMGGAVYWKVTVTLNNVPNAATAAIADFRLQALPTDSSGNLIPYQLHMGTIRYTATKPTVDLWLFVYGTPTQVMSLSDKSLSPLGLVEGVQYDPKYSLRYQWVE